MPFVIKEEATIYYIDKNQTDIRTAYIQNDSLYSNTAGIKQFLGERNSINKIIVSSHLRGMGKGFEYGAAFGAGISLYKYIVLKEKSGIIHGTGPVGSAFFGAAGYGVIGTLVGLIAGHDTIYQFAPEVSESEKE